MLMLQGWRSCCTYNMSALWSGAVSWGGAWGCIAGGGGMYTSPDHKVNEHDHFRHVYALLRLPTEYGYHPYDH